MSLSDKMKDLTKKAQDAAAEHKDQVHDALDKAKALADQRTGGKYHDQIVKAGDKADAYVDHLDAPPAKADVAPASKAEPPARVPE